MRSSRFLIAVMALLAVPAGTYAKKPTPMPCPDDVAAALAAACPCDGQKQSDGSTLPYRNHGKYVSCVVHFRNQLRKSDCLTREARLTVARCAARSTCGKEGSVVCCQTAAGTCNDASTGTGLAEVFCGNEVDSASETDADWVTSRAHITHDEATCLNAGGTSAGSGSVCTACTTTSTSTSTTSTVTTTTTPAP